MAEALLEIVIENLGSFVQHQLANYWGVRQETQKLSSNLTAIRAVLKDAEKKQIKSHAVKDWLQKLTDAAYVLDDILDECSIHSKKVQSDHGHGPCLARVHPKDILFRFNIGKRMKDITQRFHHIHEERGMFEFRPGVTEKQAVDNDDDWRQTSSVITEPIFCGRDHDREKIVKFLLEDASNSEDLSIYPIVGMGGLGKTTLAKQVFNDHRVCKHFDLTIWICVSDDFVTKTILQSIIECSTGQNPNLNTLEAMRKKVEEVLQSKRYLLVFDDVWNEDQEKWKELKGMLHCARGAKGATILVTTRLKEVASIMETHPAYLLKELSEDDSWSLFKHHAFGPNREEREELGAIGKEIVRKCVGSPLAIKTLGSLLHDECEVTQWQNVKESEIWDICEESSSITGEENSIMRALRLSYFNLELPLKRCFSFCAIFPKDFEIVKEELIHLWMANGFIKSEGNVEVEDVGNKVWKKLYHRSFFQEAMYDEIGMIRSFKMHDLFHDLAQSIMGEECVLYENERVTRLSTRVHHLHSLNSHESADMPAFTKVESLRTFVEYNLKWRREDIGRLPSNLCLRALCINSYSILSPMKGLAHLRYLSLNRSWVTRLNNFICGLQKLQILKLEYCDGPHNLLPKDLTQLQDLRHIVINGCNSIGEMPPNIGKLRHLRTLSSFVVGSKAGYGLGELYGLRLGGKLHIRGLENVGSEWDAKQANLKRKKELNRLFLSWGGNANSEGSNVNAEEVLEALEPPSTLKSFGVKGYRGMKLSSWMRNLAVLRDLVDVILYDCENFEKLPPLGKLPQLKRLYLCGMKNVMYIDDESYDGVKEKAFPSLEKLNVDNLPNLERMLRDEGVEMLPRLSELKMWGVSNLKFPRLPSVERLEARSIDEGASFMEGVVRNMPCLKTLCIRWIKGVVVPDQLSRLGALQELTIVSWEDLEYFPEHVLEGLTSLRTLSISYCDKLKSLSEGVQHLSCLESLRVYECPELGDLPKNMRQLTALRNVSIDMSRFLEGLRDIPSLQRLEIKGCKCSSLPEWVGDMTSLEELELIGCRELRSLPSTFPRLTNLCRLRINDCPHLEERCKRETGEDWQLIARIPEIELPEEQASTYSEGIRRSSCSWNCFKPTRQPGFVIKSDYFDNLNLIWPTHSKEEDHEKKISEILLVVTVFFEISKSIELEIGESSKRFGTQIISQDLFILALSFQQMAEAMLEIVIENLGSFVRHQLATFWGVHQETQKLSSNLTAIRAVLKDAEKKQIKSHAVKDWLQKLTDAAYVLDDILDKCSIQSKKDITQRFHDIHEERLRFELRVGVTEKQPVDDDWRQTSSVITEPIFCGRDHDREKIVKFLLEDASNSEDLSIYPIVGMGGLGKTTLAKQVFNDHRILRMRSIKGVVELPSQFSRLGALQELTIVSWKNPLDIIEEEDLLCVDLMYDLWNITRYTGKDLGWDYTKMTVGMSPSPLWLQSEGRYIPFPA
ncbi:unnamed protein product [Sphenostylis stenocarpa]|uniref:Uncharacterized protein n=1 Tax=Sphenostylis stenocarpa TaxID=92480 RepID=A0AA86S2K2_9FABA|nr:unnamed protein product [Sphenostylis stenocarpa]